MKKIIYKDNDDLILSVESDVNRIKIKSGTISNSVTAKLEDRIKFLENENENLKKELKQKERDYKYCKTCNDFNYDKIYNLNFLVNKKTDLFIDDVFNSVFTICFNEFCKRKAKRTISEFLKDIEKSKFQLKRKCKRKIKRIDRKNLKNIKVVD